MEPWKYTIQIASKKDLAIYYNLQIKQQWDPFDHHPQLIEATDINGCFVGKINGEDIVSCILAMKYQKYGFIGLYWVSKEHRKRGYGLKIFKAAMEYLKDCELIGLHAVQAQVSNYQKSDFQQHCNAIEAYGTEEIQISNHFKTMVFNENAKDHLDDVMKFDKKHFPFDRSNFLKKAVELGELIVSLDEDLSTFLGYGIVNKMGNNVALGPLVAETPEAAEEIIRLMYKKVKADRYVIFYCDQYKNVFEVIQKWFPNIAMSCKTMFYKTESFKNYFDTPSIYGLSSYDRG